MEITIGFVVEFPIVGFAVFMLNKELAREVRCGDAAFGDELVDGFGVEYSAAAFVIPSGQFGVIGVFGVVDGVKKVLKPWRAADIFGRGSPRAVDVAGIFGVGLTSSDRLDGNDVVPVVAHVVGVIELAHAAVE